MSNNKKIINANPAPYPKTSTLEYHFSDLQGLNSHHKLPFTNAPKFEVYLAKIGNIFRINLSLL